MQQEHKQVRSGFEESERATSSLKETDNIENTVMVTATFDAAYQAATSLSPNQVDFQHYVLAVMKELKSKIDSHTTALQNFNSRLDAAQLRVRMSIPTAKA